MKFTPKPKAEERCMSCDHEVLTSAQAGDEGQTITVPLIALFAASVGIIILNIFAPQILVGLVAPELGLGTGAAGLVAMMTVLGYAAGLVFLIPLADRVENRKLVLYMLLVAVAAGATALLISNAFGFLADLFVLAAASSVAPVLVPISASMAPPAMRGRVIGDVMSGLLVGSCCRDRWPATSLTVSAGERSSSSPRRRSRRSPSFSLRR